MFNSLAASHRKRGPVTSVNRRSGALAGRMPPSPKMTEGTETDMFDVIPSPVEVDKSIEEAKGSVTDIKHKGYNVPSDTNYFDQIRDSRKTLRDSVDWRQNAEEDSDEEIAPLQAIIPDHLKKPEDVQAY